MIWEAHPSIILMMLAVTVIGGLTPGAVAWVGQHIVDSVVAALDVPTDDARAKVWWWIGVEAALVTVLALIQRSAGVTEQLLRARLGFQVNVMILKKALRLSLSQFEDDEVYDQMTRARREASRRPLSLVRRTLGLAQHVLTLSTYGALMLAFSPIALVVLIAGAIPAFLAESRFSEQAFRLFTWRSPETRQQHYLESLLARDDFAKEVKSFELGSEFLRRYGAIFDRLYKDDRDLALRRGGWGAALNLLSTATFYGAYIWIAWETVAGRLTLGQMTMYLAIFKQGQSTLSAALGSINGIYEDNLYLSTLYDFLETPEPTSGKGIQRGTNPADGIRFEDVSYRYPDAPQPALQALSLHIPPGETLALVGKNGSGKTTLVKLLAGLYEPTSGRVLVDGVDARDWEPAALRQRIGVIFQDFVRYQLTAGENVGVGDVRYLDDEERWRNAADKGLAAPVLEKLGHGYDTQLGHWFRDGVELSIGQWQKVALSRAFMREDADILVLDEPTASMDAEAEYQIFQRFRELTEGRTAVLISHRFSTVRMADRIAVLDGGELVECDTHEALMELRGTYASLFQMQADGYQG